MSLLHILACASVQQQEYLSVIYLFFKVGGMVFLLPHGLCILHVAPVDFVYYSGMHKNPTNTTSILLK